MAAEKGKTIPAVQNEQPVPVITQQDMIEYIEYREDLQQKAMTCDHVISVLIGRGDPDVFVKQMESLKTTVLRWYHEAIVKGPTHNPENDQELIQTSGPGVEPDAGDGGEGDDGENE